MRLAVMATMAFQSANAYSSYLDACMEFAELFSGTCGGTQSFPPGFDDSEVVVVDYQYDAGFASSAPGVTITCERQIVGQHMNCPNGTIDAESCSVSRKNCVTCYRDDDSQVWIHV